MRQETSTCKSAITSQQVPWKYLSSSLINIVLTWLKRIWNLNVLYICWHPSNGSCSKKTENLFLPATIQTLDYYNGLECQEFISRVLSFIGSGGKWDGGRGEGKGKMERSETKLAFKYIKYKCCSSFFSRLHISITTKLISWFLCWEILKTCILPGCFCRTVGVLLRSKCLLLIDTILRWSGYVKFTCGESLTAFVAGSVK